MPPIDRAVNTLSTIIFACYVDGMSAQFPNVPDTKGVPAVARAGAQLQSILNGSSSALASASEALTAVDTGDYGSADDALDAVVSSASSALGTAETIFSTGSDVTNDLSGVVANANNAISSLASGDIDGAVASIDQAVSAAESAYDTVSELVNPSAQAELFGSGEEVNADTSRQWGLYTQDGDLAVEADNVVAFENSLESRISDYPVAPSDSGQPSQTVGFSSYNKVIVPFDIRLIMSRGGSVEDRQDFIKAIQDAWQSTELFNVVTPECVYLDVNVIGVRRTAAADRGMGLLTLEVALRKVRQTASLSYSQTKDASGASQVQDGSVQTSQSDDAQQYAGTAR